MKPIKLYTDLSIHLYEGEAAKKRGAPITYLTQWKIVGNSEVHTLPYPDGVVLPNGYKRCEYLTFDGSSYIDTNTTIDADTIVETAASTNQNNKCLLGCSNKDNSGRGNVCCGLWGYQNNNNILLVNHGGENSPINTGPSIIDSTKHRIVIANGKLLFDDVEYNLTTQNVYNSNTMALGTWKENNGSPDSRMWQGNIYDTIIHKQSGELWHGIPCLDANDVPCFYDLVSQTAFYNQGSGSFTYKLYPQPTEIWSCGEYNPTDGKYHILVQPLGGSIADIALTEPLRKVNDVADTIEFPSDTEGKALVTRNIKKIVIDPNEIRASEFGAYRLAVISGALSGDNNTIRTLNNLYADVSMEDRGLPNVAPPRIYIQSSSVLIRGTEVQQQGGDVSTYKQELTDFYANGGTFDVLYELATPTTELVDAPQIAEAESYSMVISQGAKAVEWSSFSTD